MDSSLQMQPTIKEVKVHSVIFHNLAGYDSNLFVKNLGKPEVNIKCNPNNEEKYISFGKDVVVGSFQKKLTSRTSFALSTASSSWLLLSINWLVI